MRKSPSVWLASFFLLFILLLILTVFIDYILHVANLVWIGRYLGIAGSVLILSGMMYSLRKRKIIKSGSPKSFLVFHEFLCWLGSLAILVHAGIHFNAILPWIALFTMIINVGSGLIGKVLLKKSTQMLADKEKLLEQKGLTRKQAEDSLFWDYTAIDLMKKWRIIHLPISLTFAVLALTHIITILLFWNWHF